MFYNSYHTLYLILFVFSLVVSQNLESMNQGKKKFSNLGWKTAAVGAVASQVQICV